ncbi:Hypothetical predicted protein [Pelobates cultripes]|uniref:UPAR/Ly6 domain-containing protein n=1 Tax=Pelobates cultripes TaxID=61616 RepID=A0AAD1WQ95_PELCU|nr:Hypothetical predicted protein [Pelobates cultripes]
MNTLLAFIYVLSALVTTGYALSCVNCVNLGGSSCTGKSVTCPAGSVCASHYVLAKSGSEDSHIFIRSCLPKKQCTLEGSVTFTDGNIKIGTSCCNAKNCNPTFPLLPDDNSQVNNITCPACISEDSETCSTSETILCTGNETQCILQSTKIKGSKSFPVALRGCSTKSFCDLGSQTLKHRDTTLNVKFTCTNENNYSHSEL